MTPEQQSELNNLDQEFFNETATLRNQIWNKSNEMDLLLNTENPDPGKLQGLQKEISELKAQIAEKRLAHRLETRKMAPDRNNDGNVRGCGRGYGKGYGKGRGGYRGNGGSGPCWN